MIWEQYLSTVQSNAPWEIALRWGRFANTAVENMDVKVERTREYQTVANDLMEALKAKDSSTVDWLAEVIEPKTHLDDTSFFTDHHLYEHDLVFSRAHDMAITGFSSCLAILAAWDFTSYKSQCWEDNKEMSAFPDIIDHIEASNYLTIFQKLVLNGS